MSYNLYRNLDGHWLGLTYCEEVYVESLVRYRMILYLVKNRIHLHAVIEFEVNNVRIRSMGDFLEILCIDSEEYILDTESIDVAWNLSCSAYSLYCCLVASLTDLALEFNVFHCVEKSLKCVTQSLS